MGKVRERIQSVLRFCGATRNPRSFFEANHPQTRTTFETMGLFFGFLLLFLVASSLLRAWVDPEPIFPSQYRDQMRLMFSGDPRFPGDVIRFALGWGAFILFAAFMRRSFAGWLGDSERAFSTYLLITCVAIIPLLSLATGLRVLANVWPYPLLESRPGWMYIRFGLSGFLLLAAWIWDGVLCVKGLQVRATQNRGRGILTWISPYVVTTILLSLLVRPAQ
ncbi:MAG: hypothetical protein K8S54_10345 [Spirochaetia bacterium]|nr:hypothetical protein [Spirochaetia bacterium]